MRPDFRRRIVSLERSRAAIPEHEEVERLRAMPIEALEAILAERWPALENEVADYRRMSLPELWAELEKEMLGHA